jgi:hypothetical protein
VVNHRKLRENGEDKSSGVPAEEEDIEEEKKKRRAGKGSRRVEHLNRKRQGTI